MKLTSWIVIMGLMLSTSMTNLAQNVTITDDSTHIPHGSAMLDVYSLSKGFLMPKLTTSQRLSIASPATGLMVFDTDSNHFYFHNGTSWENLMSITDTSSGFWKLNASARNLFMADSLNKVGIGYSKPSAKLEVWGDTLHNATDTVPLFSVKDRKGNEVFVVYPKGVRVYVDTSVFSTAKTNVTTDVTGFRVGKKTGAGSKGNGEEYFTISPDFSADTFGSQARILWYPKKEAFMSGRVWVQSPDSVGTNSWASGYHSKSIGNYSQALGYSPRAIGDYSTAIGNYALAMGDNSFALGDSTVAGGGGGSKAANNNCYAFGKGSEAIGDGSYAFGRNSLSTGSGAFSFGERDTASNTNAYAFGKGSKASNIGSVAFGYLAKSTGEDAFAFGTGTEASGKGSFAIGFIGRDSANVSTGNTKATASYAIAIGSGAQATYAGAFSLGTACSSSKNFALSMGYKTSSSGWYSVAIGNQSNASGANSIAIGALAVASGSSGTAIGNTTTASGNNSLSTGVSTIASGGSSTAMGILTTASGAFSTAMGNNSNASGQNSTAFGAYTVASGVNSSAFGAYSVASANTSTAFGSNTRAWGNAATAIGYYSKARGFCSFAMGAYIDAPSAYETVIGQYNLTYIPADSNNWNTSDRLFVIGNGTGTSARSNAVTVFKTGRTAIGHDTPSEMLDVNGNARVRSVSSGAYSAPLNITANGTFTTATSDKRLKENISPLNNSLEKVLKLQGVTFTWKNNPDMGTKIGFIAQDVTDIYPELVFRNPVDGYLGINYAEMTAVLVEAVKEQQAAILKLQQQVEIMKTENEELKKLKSQMKTLNNKYDALIQQSNTSAKN